MDLDQEKNKKVYAMVGISCINSHRSGGKPTALIGLQQLIRQELVMVRGTEWN